MTVPLPAVLVTALQDRYRLKCELGRGGMGTVYLADDLKHERPVAVKVYRPELAAVLGVERFLREIKTTANLQHPHILPLHDSGEVGGTAYFVMPYVVGESLRARLDREKQVPIDDALQITREVASALDYAHRHGVIHRDIKPENILLHEGQALVADFGIALVVGTPGETRMTESGVCLGTPHYMSPEQATGERNLDARTDVFALGCVLYEMLVGEPPFTGPTTQAIITRVTTAKPVRPTELRRAVPRQVEAAVLTALHKLPADRWPSVTAFARALIEPPEVSGHGTPCVVRSDRIRVMLHLAAALATAAWRRARNYGRQASPAGGPSIAVLPFESVGRDRATASFAEGLAELLATALGQVPGLRVAARSSILPVRRQMDDVRGVGRRLKVNNVLEGSVQRRGAHLRVLVRLVNVDDGLTRWTHRYDRETRSPFRVQDDIADAMVRQLRLALTHT